MSLKHIRNEIDRIDEEMIPLLHKRLELVLKLKKYKTSLEDPIREEEILQKITMDPIKEVYLSIFKAFKKELLKHGFAEKNERE